MNTGQNGRHSSKRVLLVECARGAAAVYVCFGHVSIIGHLAQSFSYGKFLLYPLSFGEEAVYLFFFLSGFSIHYSSRARQLDSIGGIAHYYYLRFRRIYPIFLIAVGFSIVIGLITSFCGIHSGTRNHLSSAHLTYVLLFLSDFHRGGWYSGLANDPALWSLSYEIPYYLVYPLFWRCYKRFGPGQTFAMTFVASVGFTWADCIQANHISNIFSLYWLWTGGAMMAEWKLNNKSVSMSPIPYCWLLFVCYAVSQSVEAMANPVIHGNLEALTIGVVIISTFINFKPLSLPGRLWGGGGLLLLLTVCLLATRNVPTWGRHIFLVARFVFAAVALLAILVTNANIASLCRLVARPFLKIGAISYALYVIHMPILYFVADVFQHIGMTPYWTPLALLLVFPLAWYLEIKFQPYVAGWLDLARVKVAKACSWEGTA